MNTLEPTSERMVPLGPTGRRFVVRRAVGLGDVDPSSRLRVDGLARLLQDIATADAREAGIDPGWVVRRTAIEARRWPVLGEALVLTTFCSGLGSRWAERRTDITGDRGAQLRAAAVWVHVDDAGRPARLDAGFLSVYAEAAAGRTVRAKLRHGQPPPQAHARPWVLRHSDLDVLGHVNNAATWEAVVDELGRRMPGRTVSVAEMEYPGPLEIADDVVLRSVVGDAGLQVWLTVGDGVRASATLRAR